MPGWGFSTSVRGTSVVDTFGEAPPVLSLDSTSIRLSASVRRPLSSTERRLLSWPFTNYDVENVRIKLFQEPSYLLAVRLENYTAL